MSDRELLELAAKAAGMPTRDDYSESYGLYAVARGADGYDGWRYWNPLTDDGDALRLAVRLGISLTPYPIYSEAERHSVIAKQRRSADKMRQDNPTEVAEIYGNDPCAATRRAIVRAAAEIGRAMP